MLPNDQDAEMSVLGSMLLSNDAIGWAANNLAAGDFYTMRNRLTFEAIISTWKRTGTVDLVLLRDELKGRAHTDKRKAERNQTQFEEVGGNAYLLDLEEYTPTAANIQYYGAIVRDHAARRALIKECAEARDSLFERPFLTREVALRLSKAIAERVEVIEGEDSEHLAAISDAILNRKDRAMERIETGFGALDNAFGGFRAGEVTVLAGSTSVGKSTLMLNIAYAAASTQKAPTLVCSMEMRANVLVEKIMGMALRIPTLWIRNNALTDEQREELAQWRDAWKGVPLYFCGKRRLTIDEFQTYVRAKVETDGIKLVCVDYLQLFRERGMRGRNRENEVAAMSRGIKALAMECEIAILLLSQVNRDCSKQNRPPTLSDLRESGAIEQDADFVLALHWWKPLGGDDIPVRDMQLAILKGRSSALTSFQFDFDTARGRFLLRDGPAHSSDIPF